MAARKTISLPDELRSRMDAVEEDVNWSAEAAKCFEKVLGDLATKRQEKDMSDVAARLRASKIRVEDDTYKSGFAFGHEWAINEAEYGELKRAAEYDTSAISGEWMAPWGGSDWIAFDMLGVDPAQEGNTELEEMSEEFWGDWLTDARSSDQFLVGFIEGATAVWDEVADRL